LIVPGSDQARRRRWRRYLADERAEGALYRELAARYTGEEREILLGLADAEQRHEQHWIDLLTAAGDDSHREPGRASLGSRLLIQLGRRFGAFFVLALAQRAEGRSPYDADADATDAMAADERIHGEVLRGLAARGRRRLAGGLRAAVFGFNDGLVSNLALVLGVGATGLPPSTILVTGVAGLFAGSLSMGAGEYISVRSQRELLAASRPDPDSHRALPDLDVDANELALLYRARGMSPADAEKHAREVLATLHLDEVGAACDGSEEEHDGIGSASGAAVSSILFFASGALIPIIPYLAGAGGFVAAAIAAGTVGLVLLATGAIVGLLSGGSLARRSVRQLVIGLGAAAVTFFFGLLFGTFGT
jgi:VIT1/CCC1 family predicted Fe2+/Mn2+ transporter